MSDYISSDLSANDKDTWATPQWLFNALEKEFRFQLDAAANHVNAKVPHFISEQDDAISMTCWADACPIFSSLSEKWVFINPPYSRGMVEKFINKAHQQCEEHGINSVLLVPATPDAGWWPVATATEVRFITGGRISFAHPHTGKTVNGNTKGSALIIFRHQDLGMPMVTRYVSRASLMAQGAYLKKDEAA